MEQYTQKYQFNQDGKNYVVSTGLVDDRVRVTCHENYSYEDRFYSNEFNLDELRAANQFFMITQTPAEALKEINKTIERQKSAVSPGTNDTMNFIGYLVIGTDNDIFTLLLKRDMEPNKYGTLNPPNFDAADLVLPNNYQVNGNRLKALEAQSNEFQLFQNGLEEEINRLVLEINALRKMTLDLKEENALVRERLRILQKQLEERKQVVVSIQNDNDRFKKENFELTNAIKEREAHIREVQAMQTTVKVKTRPNLSHGKTAITSKFQEAAMRTFLPRSTAKQLTEEYNSNLLRSPVASAEIRNYATNEVQIQQNTQQVTYSEQTQQPIITQKVLPVIYREQVQPVTYANPHTPNVYSPGQANTQNGIITNVLKPIYAPPQLYENGSAPMTGDNAPDIAYNSVHH